MRVIAYEDGLYVEFLSENEFLMWLDGVMNPFSSHHIRSTRLYQRKEDIEDFDQCLYIDDLDMHPYVIEMMRI